MSRSRSMRAVLAILSTFALGLLIMGPARAGQPQSIDFPGLHHFTINEYQVVEPTASSGLPVAVVVDTPQTCTLEGIYLTALAAGTCQLTATQPGNAQYDPASPVVRSIRVDKLASAVVFDKPDFVYNPDDPITLTFQIFSAFPRDDDPPFGGDVQVMIAGSGPSKDMWKFTVPVAADGTAEYVFNSPPIPMPRGDYAGLVSYTGDAQYASSYSEDPFAFIIASRTKTSVTVSPKTVTWGDEVTFDAKVTDAATGTIPDDIAGVMQFHWTGGTVVRALENGKASYTTTQMIPGANEVVAQFFPESEDYTWGTSFDKKGWYAEGLDPWFGYADGTAAVGVPMQPLHPILRGFVDPQFTASGLPQGLSIDTGTGVITGTPAKAGKSTVTVDIDDAYDQSAQATLTIEVVNSDVKPAIAYPALKAQVGKPLTPVAPQITGMTNPTFTATSVPEGLTVNAQTGVVSGTPSKVGTFSTKVTAAGAAGTASTTVKIEVVRDPVTAYLAYPDVTTVAGSPLTPVTPYTSGLSGKLTYSVAGLPKGLSAASNTGVVSGTASTAGSSKANGKVTGTGGSATSAFTVTVAASPLPKTLSYATIKGIQYQRITAAVPHLTGLMGTVSYSAKGLPKGMKLNPSTGVIKGAPKAAGKSTATVTARAANGSVKAGVKLRIAKNPRKDPIGLTVKGARVKSAKLSVDTLNRLVGKATSKGTITTHVTCTVGHGQVAGLCTKRVVKQLARVAVRPLCSVPQVSVSVTLTAHPSTKQSARYEASTWQRTWRVSATPATACVATP